ncbi:Uncharacterized protein FWK35_00035227 [Aphis craccivora]|uniref:Uncharacterized protein n=1 Tax=Aphis craccivora TaxID=307492 RepID=A0A6G0VJE4_APHCR|nr:Uncharacterized protein FWK35_00035227 [Aphis craccivora]
MTTTSVRTNTKMGGAKDAAATIQSTTLSFERYTQIAIADPVVESKSIYIHKQQIMKDVYCSSTVSTVSEGKAIVGMLNISEEIKEINITDLNKINYDIEYELYTVEVKDNL